MNEAEHALHIHNESVSNMQQTALDVIQRGQELYQVIPIAYISDVFDTYQCYIFINISNCFFTM